MDHHTMLYNLVLACILAVVAHLQTAVAAAEHSPVDYLVGGWTTDVNYTQWTKDKVFYVGDTLTFTITGADSVVRVPEDVYDSCRWTMINPPNAPFGSNRTWNLTVVPALGDNYYISPVEGHCSSGMKIAVKVLSESLAPSPSREPVYTPKVYSVGDSAGWSLGVNYQQWAANKKFYFGDAFKFVFNESHSVVEVLEKGYQSCNDSYFLPVAAAIHVGSNRTWEVSVVPPLGQHYYTSSVSDDCKSGLKLALDILPRSEASAPSPYVVGGPSESPGEDGAAGPELQATSASFAVRAAFGFILAPLVLCSFL